MCGLGGALLGISGIGWLVLIGGLAFVGAILFFVSWITPGILIILRVPWLAQAWLRGIDPFAYTDKPWEQLSTIQRFSVYFVSLLLSTFAVTGIIYFITRYFQK